MSRTAGGWPQRIDSIAIESSPLDDGLALEDELLARAVVGFSGARIWRSRPLLVVSKKYRALADFDKAAAASERRGMPVRVRRSGGGAVPQGPGILNLSVAWRTSAGALAGSEDIYTTLCALLAQALGLRGTATPSAVPGSFCDGRFNLAVGGRKIAGTAQFWRRAGDGHVVLAHALVLAAVDPVALTAVLNAFEAEAGSPRRYTAGALTSVAVEHAAGTLAVVGDDLERSVAERIFDSLLSRSGNAVRPRECLPAGGAGKKTTDREDVTCI